MKTLKRVCACFIIGVFTASIAWGVWDKDKPAAGTSLRSSNPELLANQSALQTALDAEHDFGGSTQTGSHTPGSARAFFQDDAPTTQVDGGAFAATDLGSLWFDTNATIDNQFSVLTATTPTWTPVSTEIMAFMLASGRVFTSTLGVTGNFAVNTDKFTVTAASGNTLVAGTLDVTGALGATGVVTFAIPPAWTQAAVANNTALNARNAADNGNVPIAKVDASDDIAIYHDIGGTDTAIYTKYFMGTLSAGASVNIAHGITGVDKILHVSALVWNGSNAYGVQSYGVTFELGVNATNVVIGGIAAAYQAQKYRIKLDYIL